MTHIFFDLDGTLINSQNRLYELFCELCPECTLTYSEYWEIKRKSISQKKMLKTYYNYTDEKIETFHNLWIKLIEDPSRLKKDFPVPGIENILYNFIKKYTLHIITNRQNDILTKNQIYNFGWKNIFSDILITNQKRSKKEIINKYYHVNQNDILIGDTGEDIETAKSLGMISIAVSWGTLNRQSLSKYEPHIILDKVHELFTCGIIQG